MKNSEFHFGVSVDDMDSVSRAVYDGLCNGVSKKVLANKYKMPITTINAISKRFRTGQKEVAITPAIQVYDCPPERNTNVEEEEMKSKTKDSIEKQIEERKISGGGRAILCVLKINLEEKDYQKMKLKPLLNFLKTLRIP